MDDIKLSLVTPEGARYTGRMTARHLAGDNDYDVYEIEDGRVIVHDLRDGTCFESEDPESDLEELLPLDAYVTAMDALGMVAEVDL